MFVVLTKLFRYSFSIHSVPLDFGPFVCMFVDLSLCFCCLYLQPGNCNFDRNFCGFTTSNWTRRSGRGGKKHRARFSTIVGEGLKMRPNTERENLPCSMCRSKAYSNGHFSNRPASRLVSEFCKLKMWCRRCNWKYAPEGSIFPGTSALVGFFS